MEESGEQLYDENNPEQHGGNADNTPHDSQAEEQEPPSSPEPEIDYETLKSDLIEVYLNESWMGQELVPNTPDFGKLMEDIIDVAYPPDPRPEFPPGCHYFPLKVILLGATFSGKTTIAKKMTEKYGMKVFELPKILEDRIKVLERKAELEEGKKPKGKVDEESEIFTEAACSVSAETAEERGILLRAKLRGLFGDEPKVEEEVKKGKKEEVKCQGFVLIDYPTNQDDAKGLEKALTNFVPASDLPEPIASIKKRNLAMVSKPGPRTPKPIPKETSFWDFVILLDVPEDVLHKRCFERRVDAHGNVYNLVYNPPPDNLLPKLTIPQSPTEDEFWERVHKFQAVKEELSEWFENFGRGFESSLIRVQAGEAPEAVWEFIERFLQEQLDSRIVHTEAVHTEHAQDIEQGAAELESDELQQKLAKQLVKQWEKTRVTYLKEISVILDTIHHGSESNRTQIEKFFDEFKEFLARPDQKETIVSTFAERLNNLLNSRTVLTNKAKAQILVEIDEISDQLWDIIEERKDEAILKCKELAQNSPADQMYRSIVANAFTLVKIEAIKYLQMQTIFQNYTLALQKQPLLELPTGIKLKIDKNLEIIGELGSPKLSNICFQARELAKSCENLELAGAYLCRINVIENWASQALEQIRESFSNIMELLDDWIVDAVSAENELMNQVLKSWQDSVNARKPITTFSILDNTHILKQLRQPSF